MTKFLDKILTVSIIILLFAILMTISCKYNKEDFLDEQDSSILDNFDNEYYTAVSDLSDKIKETQKKNAALQEKLQKLK